MPSTTIREVRATPSYDSNGTATVNVEVLLDDGTVGSAMAPRGSSTGQFEALVLEDMDRQPSWAAVAPALAAMTSVVAPALRGLDARDQAAVDHKMAALDPDPQLTHIGGNTTVATSMAVLEAASRSRRTPAYRHLAEVAGTDVMTSSPMINVIDGSAARGSTVYHHEFLLYQPIGSMLSPQDFVAAAIRLRAEIERGCHEAGTPVGSSMQGALSLALGDVPEGLDLVVEAAERQGLAPGEDFAVGLDIAAADVFSDGQYHFGWLPVPTDAAGLVHHYESWLARYPLGYLEDPFTDDDDTAFSSLTKSTGALVVGDDLYASHPDRIAAGVADGWSDGAVLKPNQVGSVWGVVESARTAREAGMAVLLSQRSGENGSDLIAHIACAVGASWVKCGGTTRMDRIAKINALLAIDARRRTGIGEDAW